nr:hypothetical protein CFP56_23708 [Quercus suber]
MLGASQTSAPQIKEGTLELSQQEVQRNPLPNHKGKGVAAVGLTTKERKVATEALVSITSGAGVECLSVEFSDDSVLLQESTEITFSDEDMEVGHPDHRRTLYLVASINQIPIKRALVNLGFGGRDEYTAGHIQLWFKVSPIASLARFHVVKTKVSYRVLLGRPWLHKH